MNDTSLKVVFAQAARAQLGVDAFALPATKKPSAFLAKRPSKEFKDKALARVRGRVWDGGRINGHQPGEGVAYVVSVNGQDVIFQQGVSPYAPGGVLTLDNVQAALEAHVDALAEDHALPEAQAAYLEFLAADL